MLRHFAYLTYVLRHKWYVFVACLEYGLIWRGIKHDWSKFLPSEWFPYARTFYKPDGTGQYQPGTEFDIAWNHHQKRNSHHWQYWLLSPDKPRPNFWDQSYDGGMTHATLSDDDGRVGAVLYDYDSDIHWIKKPDMDAQKRIILDLKNTPVPLEMPLLDRQEMIADWRGAGKALGKPNTWEWWEQNKSNIFLHPNTREWVEAEIAKLQHFAEVDKYRAGAT